MSDNNDSNTVNPAEEPDDVISSVGPAGVDSSGEIRISPSGGSPAVHPLASSKRAAPSVRAVLHVLYGPDSGEYPVTGAVFQIGRSRGNLQLRDPFLDPFQAQLSEAGGAMVIEDLGSTNGVFLRIADELRLEDGDEIAIGSQRVIFRNTWESVAPKPGRAPLAGGEATSPARLIVKFRDGLPGPVTMVDRPVTLGRQSADLCFPDASISERHATVTPTSDGAYMLKDLQSEHGTFIRIQDPMELIDGDNFLLGRTAIVIRYP